MDPTTDWTKAIPWQRLNRTDRRQLERLVDKSKSFDDLLRRLPRRLHHIEYLLADAYRSWVESLPSAAVRSDPMMELATVETIEQATAWLSRHGLANLAETSLGDIARYFRRSVWSTHKLRLAVAHPWIVQNHRAILAELVAWSQDARRQEALRQRWQTPVALEGLRPAQAYLLNALEDGVLLGLSYKVDAHLDPPTLHLGGGTLELDPLMGVGLDQLRIQSLLDLFTLDDADARDVLGQLDAMLRMDPARRNLMLLTRALEHHDPANDDPGVELGWLLKDTSERWSVVPVVCTPRAKGGYALKELRNDDRRPPFRAQDERAMARSTLLGTLDELEGHPLVFVRQGRRCDGLPKRIRRAQLQLGLRAGPGGTRVVLEVEGTQLPAQALSGVDRVSENWWVHPTEHAILVASVPPPLVAIDAMLARRGELVVPDAASVLQAVPWLSAELPVDADPEALGTPVAPDERPLLRLTFEGTVLHVEARVQPLPEAPSSPPGQGSPLQIGQRGPTSVHLRRDLASEPDRVRRALAPLDLPAPEAPFTWRLDDLQDALELVERLRGHTEDLRVQWGGDRPRLASRHAQASDLALRVEAGRDWFGLSGSVEVDGHQVALRSLLDAAMEGHPWVPLSDGQWLRLTDDLRQHLAAAAAASTDHKGSASLQAVHAPLLAPLVEAGAELQAPEAWLSASERCRTAATLDPQVPEALQAELRPYQREGVQWLLRLAHWAPGACLADDMGLGKTVQTIALLLARADRPSLVVAPTSLLHNWQRELERFGPSLDVEVHHGTGRALAPAPGRVTLTTYGVLIQDAEALAATGFGTVVFDEAHALKNPSSLRAKAARSLDGAFVVALTGTPVENRVGELWSLFRVVVPGLLGGASAFRERFVVPIEGRGDTRRRRHLAHLVAPFVLRRTKRQVASDLPDRTELVHRVVLSDEERTLYDRTRLASLARLEAAGQGKRMQILEELLRLRKLACHPRLFDATSTVASSKLKAVRRLVADVRESGQRMLLFSTFTTHLALIREALEADGVALRYLDGAMTPKQRVDEVDAFQSGQGDVFLISTKAGGVGLNLTAATVVAHVDPWWNPASEDQATDRAHRIGQTDPVTVVRFVAVGTIEEQIVALHATKRELADALLAESGSSRHVGLEELVALLSSDELPEPPPAAAPPVAEAAPTAAEAKKPRTRKAKAEPAAPAAPAPSAAPTADAEALLAGYRALLEAGRRSGEIRSDNTVRSYHRAMGNFFAWHDGTFDVDRLEEAGERYVAAAAADQVPHRSDKVYARPALRRLVAWMRDGTLGR